MNETKIRRVIWKGPDFCAVEENGVLQEYFQTDSRDQAGAILMGKVDRMMPGLGCAFVDIGRKKAGFLPLKENSLSFQGTELKSGMKIAVQIRKEEIGEKGAFLTRDLTLPGRNILLMPRNRYIGVSSRISDEEKKAEFRETGKRIAAERTGLVIRANALQATEEEIKNETELLIQEWKETEKRIGEATTAGEVLYETDPIRRLTEDYGHTGISEVRETDILPTALEAQKRIAGNRTIRIGNGGNIIIDRCEAMTVIDVNTGSASGSGTPEATILETNLAACEAIASQVRLRNLSGMILIDFIDMPGEEARNQVENRLRDAFTRDRRKTVIHGWTRLGLMEMTRKRTGNP